MEEISAKDFYIAVLTAGAILTGFSGSFLSFRIQREANYYRAPFLSKEYGRVIAKDAYIGLSHFTSSFLLIIIAVLLEIVFGFLLPLLALSNAHLTFLSPALVTSGLVAALIFLIGYFCAELVHYKILNWNLLHDKDEWGRQWGLVTATITLASLSFVYSFAYLS